MQSKEQFTRIRVRIPEGSMKGLKELSQQTEIPISDLVSMSLDDYLQKNMRRLTLEVESLMIARRQRRQLKVLKTLRYNALHNARIAMDYSARAELLGPFENPYRIAQEELVNISAEYLQYLNPDLSIEEARRKLMKEEESPPFLTRNSPAPQHTMKEVDIEYFAEKLGSREQAIEHLKKQGFY